LLISILDPSRLRKRHHCNCRILGVAKAMFRDAGYHVGDKRCSPGTPRGPRAHAQRQTAPHIVAADPTGWRTFVVTKS
jgi:hypothetical protein